MKCANPAGAMSCLGCSCTADVLSEVEVARPRPSCTTTIIFGTGWQSATDQCVWNGAAWDSMHAVLQQQAIAMPGVLHVSLCFQDTDLVQVCFTDKDQMKQ